MKNLSPGWTTSTLTLACSTANRIPVWFAGQTISPLRVALTLPLGVTRATNASLVANGREAKHLTRAPTTGTFRITWTVNGKEPHTIHTTTTLEAVEANAIRLMDSLTHERQG